MSNLNNFNNIKFNKINTSLFVFVITLSVYLLVIMYWWAMDTAMMKPTMLTAIMMGVIAVSMSSQINAQIAYAILRRVVPLEFWLGTDTAMMNSTMKTATMMVVTVAQLSIQSTQLLARSVPVTVCILTH